MANFKIKNPENVNYCGIICEINKIVELDNCDNLVHAIIFGNKVIVTKDVKIGDVGVFFPCGTQMSDEFLKINNMYSKKELNTNQDVRGYFGNNGLVRCVKLRGNQSEGLFVSLDTIKPFLKPNDVLELGDVFDVLNDHVICKKYIPITKQQNNHGSKRSKNDKKIKQISRMVEDQFRFHIDTAMLYRNLDKFNRNDLISVTYKIHGTSGISSYILCKKQHVNILEWLNAKITKKDNLDYEYVYASRKVIKNEFFSKNEKGFYGEDIWCVANEELKPFLKKGMTFYYEIAGYLQSGGEIQKDYHYGCEQNQHKVFIYRITYTNQDGNVFEFSMKQVQDFCKEYGLNAVPLLYYGTVGDYVQKHLSDGDTIDNMTEIDFQQSFLKFLKDDFNEKDCYICNSGVPEEGCVVRKETNLIESYKVKSTRFYEKETQELEEGVSNIEDQN